MGEALHKLVFLDIDGVVNSGRNYHEWNAAHDEALQRKREQGTVGMTGGDDRWVTPADDPFVLKLFDEENVGYLNRITQEAGAKIVVSSSWRMFYARHFDHLVGILAGAGVTAEVIAPTPCHIPHRGAAIDGFLQSNFKGKSVHMVILDDEPKYSFTQNCDPWLVQTDGAKGLQEKDIARALKVLNGRRWNG